MSETFDPEDVVHGAGVVAWDASRTLGHGGALYIPGRRWLLTSYPFANRGQQMGAEWMGALSELTLDEAGDGAGRSVVIANEILKGSVEQVRELSIPPSEIVHGIERGVTAVTDELTRLTKRFPTAGTAARVAAVAVGADDEIGDLLGRALARVGPQGKVRLEVGRSPRVEVHGADALITLSYLDMPRLERARRAYRAATHMMQVGGVRGAGMALTTAGQVLEGRSGTPGEKIGFQILRNAIAEPTRLIAKNVRAQESFEVHRTPRADDTEIFDPFWTVKTSVAHAAWWAARW